MSHMSCSCHLADVMARTTCSVSGPLLVLLLFWCNLGIVGTPMSVFVLYQTDHSGLCVRERDLNVVCRLFLHSSTCYEP